MRPKQRPGDPHPAGADPYEAGKWDGAQNLHHSRYPFQTPAQILAWYQGWKAGQLDYVDELKAQAIAGHWEPPGNGRPLGFKAPTAPPRKRPTKETKNHSQETTRNERRPARGNL